MHKYLRAIGFSDIKSKKMLRELLDRIVTTSNDKIYTSNGEDVLYTECRKEFADNIGITVCGEYDEENNFTLQTEND